MEHNSTWFLNPRQHQSSVLGALLIHEGGSLKTVSKLTAFSCPASPLNVRLAYRAASYLSPLGWTPDLSPACSSHSFLSQEVAASFLWELCSHLNLCVCVCVIISVFSPQLPCKLSESRDHACLHCLTKGLAYSTHSRTIWSVEWKYKCKCNVSDDGLNILWIKNIQRQIESCAIQDSTILNEWLLLTLSHQRKVNICLSFSVFKGRCRDVDLWKQ